MTLTEQYARTICQERGLNPDEPVTIGKPDGSSEFHEIAWKGYAALADRLLALHAAAEA